MDTLKAVMYIHISYLIGSVSFALVIGKSFFNTDIREYGSGNLGATNAGRVLGSSIFYLVAALDALKAFAVYMLVHKINNDLALVCSAAVVIGHCYPVFTGFKGGKGVACCGGLLLGIALVENDHFLQLLVIPLAVLVIIALTTGYMSLASMSAFVTAVIMSWLFAGNTHISITITLLCLLVIFRHRDNIKRLIEGKENRISFRKKS